MSSCVINGRHDIEELTTKARYIVPVIVVLQITICLNVLHFIDPNANAIQ